MPLGPTVSLVAAYRTAIERQALAPPIDMDAMQIRPKNNVKLIKLFNDFIVYINQEIRVFTNMKFHSFLRWPLGDILT